MNRFHRLQITLPLWCDGDAGPGEGGAEAGTGGGETDGSFADGLWEVEEAGASAGGEGKGGGAGGKCGDGDPYWDGRDGTGFWGEIIPDSTGGAYELLDVFAWDGPET